MLKELLAKTTNFIILINHKSQSTNLKKNQNFERPSVQNVDLGLLSLKHIKYFAILGGY